MPTYHEPIRNFTGVTFKIDPLSVEKATIVSGAGVLVPGTVLGRITANGNLRAYDPGNSPAGIGTAVAILVEHVDATSAAVEAAVVARMAAVDTDSLVWGAGVTTDAHKTTALGHLKTHHILAQ